MPTFQQQELPLPFPELSGDQPLLPARMINEFVYCPRLAYMEWVQGEWGDSADTVQGRHAHRRVDRQSGKLPVTPELSAGRGSRGHDPRLGKVQQMLEFIAAHYDQPITAGEVAAAAELHPHYAMGQFKKVMRTSIKQYINGLRINQAKALLADTDRPILDIALAVGFGSSSRFYEVFQRQLEMTPEESPGISQYYQYLGCA